MGTISETLGLFANSLITSYHQNEPQIKIYAGVAGLIVSGIWACVNTVKNSDILADASQKIEQIKEEAPSEETASAEIVKVKAKTGAKVALNYLGPITLAAFSTYNIVGGEREYHTRNLESVAAIKLLEKKYDTIVDRIETKYGEKAKNEILYDIKTVKKEEEVEDPETGKKKSRVVTKKEAGEDASKGFKIVLNRYNWKLWQDDYDTNWNTLFGIQCEANRELMNAVAFNKGNGAVRTASDILRRIEWTEVDDLDIQRDLKNKGCVWTPDHPVEIDFGLKASKDLKDFSVFDEDEVVLHINFVDNVWSYR